MCKDQSRIRERVLAAVKLRRVLLWFDILVNEQCILL